MFMTRFCLSLTIFVGILPGFVCLMDSYGWYSTRFCLSWIILVGISPCFVCRGQKWMVYQPILSVMEIIVDISSGFCLSWTKKLVYQPVLSVTNNIGCYVIRF